MGLDEHSLNVYRKAREQGLDPLAYCDRMAQQFREVWARLDISFDDFIRTTEPRHRVAVQEMVETIQRRRRPLRGRLRGLVLRLVRGLQAGEGSRRRAVSDPPDEAGLDPRDEPLLPAVGLSRSAAGALRGAPGVPAARTCRRNEILRLLEGGLEDISISRAGQPWGIPVPLRSVERRLRVVRRADQLHHRGRLRRRSGPRWRSGGRPTCTSSARTSRASTRSCGRRC